MVDDDDLLSLGKDDKVVIWIVQLDHIGLIEIVLKGHLSILIIYLFLFALLFQPSQLPLNISFQYTLSIFLAALHLSLEE